MEEVLFIREKDFKSKREALSYIASELDFPSYFGKNLDALFDCLTEMDDTVYIAMDPVPTEESKEWFQRIYEVISDAAAENENIIVLCRADDIEAVL